MSTPIGPGDWVECIKTHSSTSPNLGRVFCIEAVLPEGPCSDGHSLCVGLVLAGFYSDMPNGEWMSCAFRPIYRPKANFIQSLLEPVEA